MTNPLFLVLLETFDRFHYAEPPSSSRTHCVPGSFPKHVSIIIKSLSSVSVGITVITLAVEESLAASPVLKGQNVFRVNMR